MATTGNHRSGGGHRKRIRKIKPVTDTPDVEEQSQLATGANGPIREGNEAPSVVEPKIEAAQPETQPEEQPAPLREPEPEMPSWESLFPNEPAAKPPKSMPEAFARFYSAMFKVPQMMQLGDQWPLTREEAAMLAVATADAINSLPKKSSSQAVAAIKALTKALPFLTLPATFWIVLAPRVQVSVDLLAARRAGREQETSFGQPDSADYPGNQAPRRSAANRVPTWEEFVRRNH